MAETPRFDEGQPPAIRASERQEDGRHLADFPCPYCGHKALLISSGDLPCDELRIELYCDNHMCDVRELTILPLRTNVPTASIRSDAVALRAVDDGTEIEQEADGYTLHRDEEGEVVARSASLGSMTGIDLEGAVLGRRKRMSKIEILPGP